MIDPLWKRVAGLHIQEQGQIGAVWIAHDKETDTVHLYDACVFKKDVWPVICEGINARGRWIPIAWSDKDMSKEMLNKGCRMLYDPEPDSAEMISREIEERMRSERFKVDKRLGEWLEEYKTYFQSGSKIPQGFPLMTATRLAVANLKRAKRLQSRRKSKINYPKVAII